MLDAILSALSPRTAAPSGAAARQGGEPPADRFDTVYEKRGMAAERETADTRRHPEEQESVGDRAATADDECTEPCPTPVPGAKHTAAAALRSDRTGPPATGDAAGAPDTTVEPVEPATAGEDLPITAEAQAIPGSERVAAPPVAVPEGSRHTAEPAADHPEESADPMRSAQAAANADGAEANADDRQRDHVPPREQPLRTEAGGAPADARSDRTAGSRNDPERAQLVPRAAEIVAQRPVDMALQTASPAEPLPAATAASSPQAMTSAQPAPAAVPAAPFASGVIEQLAVAVKQSHDGRVDLTLSPVELGRVRLTLLTGESGITVAIRAEREETLDLFRRNSETLAQEFRQMGYGSVGFQFSSGQQRHPRDKDDDAGIIASTEPVPTLPASVLRLAGIGGLDIRL